MATKNLGSLPIGAPVVLSPGFQAIGSGILGRPWYGTPTHTIKNMLDGSEGNMLQKMELAEELGLRLGKGHGWSYYEYLQSEHGKGSWETAVAEKVCRCESHYLFCWGHQKYCDYHEDKK